jgi:hypothetical protein
MHIVEKLINRLTSHIVLFLIMSSEKRRRIRKMTEDFARQEAVTHIMRLTKTDCSIRQD